MKESALERHLAGRVRALGGLTVKLASTGTAGVPDRLILMPGQEPLLVELKTETGRISSVQREWITQAECRGFPVHVLYGKVGVTSFIERITMSDRIAKAAGRLSAARRWKGRDGAPDETEARAELAEAKLERAIVAASEDLTPEARTRLSALLDDGDVL